MRHLTLILVKGFSTLLVIFALSSCGIGNNPSHGLHSLDFNGTAGIKNFREYQEYFEETTDETISSSLITKLQPRLSPRGRVYEAGPVTFLAMTMMAGNYCKEFVSQLAAYPTGDERRRILVDADLSSGSAYASFRNNPQAKTAAIEEFMQLMLQRSPTAEESDLLGEAIEEIISEHSSNSAADLRVLYSMLCMIIGSSTDAIRS